MARPADDASGFKVLATNRKAHHDYAILEKIEAGLELRGAEVKSMRAGNFSLQEGYATIENRQLILHGLHVQPYSHSRLEEQDPDRPKRLLLHRAQIEKLVGQTAHEGHTIVPLRVYLAHGLVKVEIGVARGKQTIDKRESLKRKTADREARRAVAHKGRGR